MPSAGTLLPAILCSNVLPKCYGNQGWSLYFSVFIVKINISAKQEFVHSNKLLLNAFLLLQNMSDN